LFLYVFRAVLRWERGHLSVVTELLILFSATWDNGRLDRELVPCFALAPYKKLTLHCPMTS